MYKSTGMDDEEECLSYIVCIEGGFHTHFRVFFCIMINLQILIIPPGRRVNS